MPQNLSSAVAFNILPIELNQAMAKELETDREICAFRAVCRGTKNAIDGDKFSFWRGRFREKYAFKEGKSNRDLKKLYQRRAKYLRRATALDFFRGYKAKERDALEVLRDLIVESFQGETEIDEYSRVRCKNQIVLRKFVVDSMLLFNPRRAPGPNRTEPNCVNPLLLAIKLICSQFMFEIPVEKQEVLAVDESQRAVYGSSYTYPIYKGPDFTDLNLEWVFHCMQFFRHHMMNKDVASLFAHMKAMSPTQKPSSWTEQIRQGPYILGKHWKGTYAFLDPREIHKLRKLTGDEDTEVYFADKNIDEGRIQSLELDFVTEGEQLRWPAFFEERLHSLRNTVEPPVKAQSRGKPKDTAASNKQSNLQFVGHGEDLDDVFNAIGWLNPLPEQCGIPGWQRITFMKHFMDDFDQVEQDNLWAYEGVVLPGGKIILGRWWYASELVNLNQDYNGPFILWAVDEPDA